jgi:hypothetical protein
MNQQENRGTKRLRKALTISKMRRYTAMCKNAAEDCPFGEECIFAHDASQLIKLDQQYSETYRRKPCENLRKHGTCPYGSKCFFSHDDAPIDKCTAEQAPPPESKATELPFKQKDRPVIIRPEDRTRYYGRQESEFFKQIMAEFEAKEPESLPAPNSIWQQVDPENLLTLKQYPSSLSSNCLINPLALLATTPQRLSCC